MNETLTKAIQKAKVGAQNEEGKEYYTERVKQKGLFGSFKRNFLFWADDGAGYDEVMRTRAVIKAGAVVDLLIKMHDECAEALNRNADNFKSVFKEELYKKILSKLCEIIHDNGLIDPYAFKKSVNAVTGKIKFEEFDYTDLLPSEIGAQMGVLKRLRSRSIHTKRGNAFEGF
ncbi:hypothetical protein Kyoto57A_13790 [Helicobacter pylori]